MEVWKSVPGFKGYRVSNLGRLHLRNGKIRESKPGPVLLCGKTRKWFRSVARIVLLAFKGPAPKGKKIARHLDDNVNHNWLENLAWGSYQDNYDDAVRNKRHGAGSPGARKRSMLLKGTTRPDSVRKKISRTWFNKNKLTDEAVRTIKDRSNSRADLSVRFGVSLNTIDNIRGGYSYAKTQI